MQFPIRSYRTNREHIRNQGNYFWVIFMSIEFNLCFGIWLTVFAFISQAKNNRINPNKRIKGNKWIFENILSFRK